METDLNLLGLESNHVVLREYQPEWAEIFRRTEAQLRQALGDRILAVHHVGSIAIEGLCAKPILDVMVSVEDLQRSLALVPALEKLGYEFRPGEEIPDRHFFRRSIGELRTHHLSLAQPDSVFHFVTLAFRDALRAHPVLAFEYAELKRDLAARHPLDRKAYLAGKTEFIESVLHSVGVTPRPRTPAA